MLGSYGVQPVRGLYTHLCSLISTLHCVLPPFLSWEITQGQGHGDILAQTNTFYDIRT